MISSFLKIKDKKTGKRLELELKQNEKQFLQKKKKINNQMTKEA